MNVSNPITSVIPSLDGKVYAVLCVTDAPLSLGAIHILSGGPSKSGVRSVLQRMAAAGLVDVVPGGYLLNRDHVAADAIQALASLHGELTRRIREDVREWTFQPLLVGYYGSTARRDGNEASDIDVLVVGDVERLAEAAFELAGKIERWTGNMAQVEIKSLEEIRRLRRAKEPILDNWKRELVEITGSRSVLSRAS